LGCTVLPLFFIWLLPNRKQIKEVQDEILALSSVKELRQKVNDSDGSE
jgi:hypothetical protein